MSATILHLDADVAAKFKNAKAMLNACRAKMSADPKAALDYAQASARKVEEALVIAREKGSERLI